MSEEYYLHVCCSTALPVYECNSETLEKLRSAVAKGRANATTKRNKILSTAEKELSRNEKELSAAINEVILFDSQHVCVCVCV